MKEENIQSPIISQIEKWGYRVVLISSILYSLLQLYLASVDNKTILSIFSLEPGWSLINDYQDGTYEVWKFWSSSYISIGPFLFGHVILNLIINYININLKKYVYPVYSLAALYWIFGLNYVLIMLLHCWLAYIVSSMGSLVKSWLVFACILVSFTEQLSSALLMTLCLNEGSSKMVHTLNIMSLGILMLKYISFCTEWIESRKMISSTTIKFANPPKRNQVDKKLTYTFIDMLCYCFYLPNFFFGPVINYDEFYIHFHKTSSNVPKTDIMNLLKKCLCFLLAAIISLLAFHFIYFSAIAKYSNILSSIPLWALGGVVFCLVLYFHWIYLFLFGLTAQLSEMDGIPSSFDISITTFAKLCSPLWKTFDCGLYSWMKQNIFKSFGGDQHGMLWRLASFGTCCIFGYYWSNDRLHIQVWLCVMFLDYTVENFLATVCNVPTMKEWRKKNISLLQERIILVIWKVWLDITYALIVCYFVCGLRFFLTVPLRLLFEGAPTSILIVLLNLYCYEQILLELDKSKIQ